MWSEWAKAAQCAVPDPPTKGLLYLAGSNLLTDAALAGQGVAICREALIASYLRDGRLLALSQTAIDAEAWYFYTLSNAGRKQSTVSQVVSWLGAMAQRIPHR